MIQKALALLASTSLLGLARADDAFSNLGPSPNAYNAISSYFINPTQTKGFQFTATATGTLTGFQVAMNNASVADGRAAFSFSLYANSGADTLGALLGTYAGASTGASYQTATNALASVASGSPMAISSGRKYWLIASSGNSLAWNTSLSGTTIQYLSGGGYYPGSTSGAFSIQVNPVPEPATLGSLGLGIAAFIRKRRKG